MGLIRAAGLSTSTVSLTGRGSDVEGSPAVKAAACGFATGTGISSARACTDGAMSVNRTKAIVNTLRLSMVADPLQC